MMNLTPDEKGLLQLLLEAELSNLQNEEGRIFAAENVAPDMIFLNNAKEYETKLRQLLVKFT